VTNRALLLCLAAIQIGSLGSAATRRTKPAPGAGSLSIASPVLNQVVSGTLHLAPSGNLAGVSSVEFLIGNYRIARQAAAPFTYDWNSALAADGDSQIEFIARDPFDNIVFDQTVPVTLQNFNDKAQSTNGALDQTLSGTVALSLRAVDSVHFPAYWQLFVDGELFALRFTDETAKGDVTLTQNLDTTRYPNGKHEFHFAFHSNDYGVATPPGGPEDFRGMITRNVTLDNGRTFMDVQPNYLHVYTAVGGTVALGCARLYTNLDQSPCLAPQYAAADPTVVSVDPSGNLTGLKEGFTDVTLTEGGKTAVAHAWVRNTPGVPHFVGDGNYSTAYVDGKSIFAIAPFLLEPNSVRDPATLAEVKRAGVNTLTRGLYINPTDLTTSFAAWQASYDSAIAPDWAFAAANGFHAIASGDDVARVPGAEGWRTLNWPNGKAAVQYAIQKFAASGAALSVDMIDEASALWGPNPQPPGKLGAANSMQAINCAGTVCTVTWPGLSSNQYHDQIGAGLTFVLTGDPALSTPAGQVYTVGNVTASTFDFTPAAAATVVFTPQSKPNLEFLWFARKDTCGGAPCTPSLPNSVLATITGWLKSAPATAALSWPPAGVALTATQANWLGPGSLSDYASHYWDTNQQRATYVFGKGVRESQNSILTSFYARQPVVQLGRPQLMEIGITGTNYTKNSPPGTDTYNPPLDDLQHVGNVPKAVTSTMMEAAAVGIAGLRIYQFETPGDYALNTAQGPGGGGVQTGAGPFTGEVANWRAMGYAANALGKAMQPYVLGAALSSPAYGRNVVSGARRGAGGNMLMVVNGWDGARQLAIDFRPYKNGSGCVRYRVSESAIKTALLPDSDGETVQLDSGESVVYIFPNSAAAPIDTVAFSAAPSNGAKVALRYGYVFAGNVAGFGEAVDCSNGCSLAIDRKLGDVFYQYTVVDACGTVVSRSGMQTLGAGNSVALAVPGVGKMRSCQ
jgi:hypothetical protein